MKSQHHQYREKKKIMAILDAKNALDKEAEDRTERDIDLIYKLCSCMDGFKRFHPKVRRCLATCVILAVVDDAQKEVLGHDELLDSFCVLIHGRCIHYDSTRTQVLHYYDVGDAFGVCEPTTDPVKFDGYMRTECEKCAFLCVRQSDFYRILTDEANHIVEGEVRYRDEFDRVICVTKCLNPDAAMHTDTLFTNYTTHVPNDYSCPIPRGHVIMKATGYKLLTSLVDGFDQYDPDYMEDFLLTFRIFMRNDCDEDQRNGLPPGMSRLCDALLSWLKRPNYRDKVIRIILAWMSSYYQDFELNSTFSDIFFRNLEAKLLGFAMYDQLRLLHVTLSAKSRAREIIITRSDKNERLPFVISGGYEKGCGIFVDYNHNHDSVDCDQRNTLHYRDPSMLSSRLINDSQRLNGKLPHSNDKAQDKMRPGDQILEVNGINFRLIRRDAALKILNEATHLSITVKYNPSAFFEMRVLREGERRKSSISISSLTGIPMTAAIKLSQTCVLLDGQRNNSSTQSQPSSPLLNQAPNGGFETMIKSGVKTARQPGDAKSRFTSLINSSKHIVKQFRDVSLNSNSNNNTAQFDQMSRALHDSSDVTLHTKMKSCNHKAKSNPDLTNSKPFNSLNHNLANARTMSDEYDPNSQLVAIRVFNAANNDHRYLLVHERTTAREVVMIAVQEFNLASDSKQTNLNGVSTSSLDWALYEVSVVLDSETIKQSRLPEQMSNLAEKASLFSRFYIKNNALAANSLSKLDDRVLADDIIRECPPTVHLTNFNAKLVALELTLSDFEKFRHIEPQQFVYDTYFDSSPTKQSQREPIENEGKLLDYYGQEHFPMSTSIDTDQRSAVGPKLRAPREWLADFNEFASISNKEMFWVVCEILNERSLKRRVKIVKKFVNVAKECYKLRNFNSMLAIISGLGHNCVTRLKETFDKLPTVDKESLKKMQEFFDPSCNMSVYRTELRRNPPPAIPLFPQIKKDFFFFGNSKKNPIFSEENNRYDADEDDFGMNTIRRRNGVDNKMHASDITVLVNFETLKSLSKQVKEVTYHSSVPYASGLLAAKKDSNTKSQSNIKKKMYEEWQMRKRVRNYLKSIMSNEHGSSADIRSNSAKNYNVDCVDSGVGGSIWTDDGSMHGETVTTVITYDERELLQRSLKIEPDQVSNHQEPRVPRPDRAGSSGQVSSALSVSSVNTATSSELCETSSLSSCSSFNSPSLQSRHPQNFHFHMPRSTNPGMLKFGADSLDEVQKMKELCEGVKTTSRSTSASSVLTTLYHPPRLKSADIKSAQLHVLPPSTLGAWIPDRDTRFVTHSDS
ncbi:Rap guanine nucleotide exchange factor 2 [Fragariocoptes setiger]|uniref:Rap guanine nucleotide exchange factor 2 n=1 Tax=Fragariocoptes setiger TaxID=1670756 RepID=A0ABQ7SA46_9ACAR|nr:Rap guanine nucleotide exchange factor 2 [Fragariocoptes setiger]